MLSMWLPCRHGYPTPSKPLVYVTTHCQLSKYKPADTYTNTQSSRLSCVRLLLWPPLHRDDIWTGSSPIFVLVRNVPFPLLLLTLSLFLCISEGPCVEGNEDRKVKRKRREISQSVCHLTFQKSLSCCCCSSLCAAVGFHVVEKWFPFVSLSCQSPLRLSLTGRWSIYIINNVKINVYLWSELKVLTFDISRVVTSALCACAWLIIQRRRASSTSAPSSPMTAGSCDQTCPLLWGWEELWLA